MHPGGFLPSEQIFNRILAPNAPLVVRKNSVGECFLRLWFLCEGCLNRSAEKIPVFPEFFAQSDVWPLGFEQLQLQALRSFFGVSSGESQNFRDKFKLLLGKSARKPVLKFSATLRRIAPANDGQTGHRVRKG